MIDIVFNCPTCNKRPITYSFTHNDKTDIIYECCHCGIIGLNNWNSYCILKSTVLKHENKLSELQEIIQLLIPEICPYCKCEKDHSPDCVIGKGLKYKPLLLK